MEADGYSLDDKRDALLDDDKLGVTPDVGLAEEDHAKNNLPDVLARWQEREGSEIDNPRTAQSFCVQKEELAENGYDLSPNRYKKVEYEEVNVRAPLEIIEELEHLELQILKSMSFLREESNFD